MADDGDKRTYPRLPAKNWWTLRDQFKKTMPSKVDADYLQSVLGVMPMDLVDGSGPLMG